MLESIKLSLKNALISSNDHFEFDENSIELHILFDEKGDLTSNICMKLSKKLKLSPKEIAQNIIKIFSNPFIKIIELAGPGFLNFFLSDEGYNEILSFKHLTKTKPTSVNIEFVSANPTGPLHLAHGRGAVVGDVLSNLYEFQGFKVNREYYVNNTGNQINEFLSSILFSISNKHNFIKVVT